MSLTLAESIPIGRIVHYIHRVTSLACRMTHLLRRIPPDDVMKLWREFDERQSAWFESIFIVPRSTAARRQACLPL